MIEDYAPSGRLADFVNDAVTYLDRNRGARYAPRVALDVLLVAQKANDELLSNRMKAFLLFEHPGTLQGAHVLTTFEDAREFRQFLVQAAQARLKMDPSRLPNQFTQAVEVGLAHFKGKLLHGGQFLLSAYCLADAAGAGKVANVVLPALRQEASKDASLRALVDVCLDRQLDVAQKIMRLHGKEDDADFIEAFLLSRLSEADKQLPGIVSVRAENAIESRDYEKALTLLESMDEEARKEPRHIFWRAWALYALRRDRQALTALAEIVKRHGGSKWAETAKTYAEKIRHFAEYRQANVDRILAVSKTFRGGTRVLQMRITHEGETKTGSKRVLSAYVGIDMDENRLEFCVYKNGALALAYRTDANRSAVYMENVPHVLAFKKPGPAPASSLSIDREASGRFVLKGGFNLDRSMARAGTKSLAFFDSPYLSTPDGIEALLDYTARRTGSVPGQPVTKNGETTLAWHSPVSDSPGLSRLEYRVTANNMLSCIAVGGVTIGDLRYGPTGAFRLTPPSWPARPVEAKEEVDFDIIVKVMRTVIALLKAKE